MNTREREKVKIINIDAGNYYTMLEFPEGFILKRYSSEIISPENKNRDYPKEFKVFEVIGDAFCADKEDVLDFFRTNYNIDLNMSIFE
ncbi:MAG: hypothetical protein N4A44_01650 [Alphaproteobacteria bacterium]|jgi:hypothetical protein|nr:hypothetical protein [Alphaproteobacteria bacterium]